MPHLAVVVPYRDRADQLAVFGRYLHSFLADQAASGPAGSPRFTFEILIVEQSFDDPFNRAGPVTSWSVVSDVYSRFPSVLQLRCCPTYPTLSHTPLIVHAYHACMHAALFNAGVVMAPTADYFAFHDVDELPLPGVSFDRPDSFRHLTFEVSRWDGGVPYPSVDRLPCFGVFVW